MTTHLQGQCLDIRVIQFTQMIQQINLFAKRNTNEMDMQLNKWRNKKQFYSDSIIDEKDVLKLIYLELGLDK